jgi:hypothetical protein
VEEGGLFSRLTGLFSTSTQPNSSEFRRRNLRDTIDEIKLRYLANPDQPGVDMLLVVDDQADRADEVLNLIRSRGIEIPVIAGAGLDERDFLRNATFKRTLNAVNNFCQAEASGSPRPADPAGPQAPATPAPEAGSAAKGLRNVTLIAGVFDRNSQLDQVKTFVEKYKQNYRRPPDFIAAQGYEAMTILAQAFARSASIAPVDVADVLRSQGPFNGLTEKVCFTPEGDIKGKRIYIKVFQNEETEEQ